MAEAAVSRITIPVGGMTCAACQAHVEKALTKQPGVEAATVNLMMGSAAVVFDPSVIKPATLVDAIRDTGYEASLPAAGQDVVAEQDAREAVAVPPEASKISLSKSKWRKLPGFCRAIVGSPQRFIKKAPSPSIAMTLRCGSAMASPAAIDETRPSVRVFRLPSLGRTAHHSRAAQPVQTASASPASSAIALR